MKTTFNFEIDEALKEEFSNKLKKINMNMTAWMNTKIIQFVSQPLFEHLYGKDLNKISYELLLDYLTETIQIIKKRINPKMRKLTPDQISTIKRNNKKINMVEFELTNLKEKFNMLTSDEALERRIRRIINEKYGKKKD